MNARCPVSETRARLLRQKGHYRDIATRSGLSLSWILKFANGERGKRPQFATITQLVAALDSLESEAKPTRKRAQSM